MKNNQKKVLKKVFSAYKKIEHERKFEIAQTIVFAKWDLINTIPELIKAFPILAKEAK